MYLRYRVKGRDRSAVIHLLSTLTESVALVLEVDDQCGWSEETRPSDHGNTTGRVRAVRVYGPHGAERVFVRVRREIM